MAETYRSIYDRTIYRPDDTRSPKPTRDDRIPSGQVWVRDDAGLPGVDRGDGKSPSERLEDEIQGSIKSMRRKAGLVGGPSQGGVDMAIEQKLKQSAGGAAILAALLQAWLREHAPHWDGTMPSGSPFGLQGMGSDWVGGEPGQGSAPGKEWGGASQYSGSGPHELTKHPPSSQEAEKYKGLGLSGALIMVTKAIGYLSGWLKLPDFDGWHRGPSDFEQAQDSFAVPDLDPMGGPMHFSKSAWQAFAPQIEAQKSGEWVWGGREEGSGGGSARPGNLPDAASLLGMEPGEWVWGSVSENAGL